MAAAAPEPTSDTVPRTPGIRETRPDKTEPGSFDFGRNPRVEIDTSPPFGSVKEAVTHFGGSGSWVPLHRLRDACNGVEHVDIKKVEEQAAELEKDLIVKELETLDVLEELATTKRIVEELKRQLHKEALRCIRTPDHLLHSDDQQMLSPVTKEMNMENLRNLVGSSSPCPNSSPDLILMELKQAKLNLGKTMNDLGVIQSSVESLNMKLKEEKSHLEKTRKRLTSKFAGVLSLEEELKDIRVPPAGIARELPQQARQFQRVAEAAKSELARLMPETKVNLKTYEMRWFAAKKMEEAARAAEALALCEIKALSGRDSEYSSGFILPEPEKIAPLEDQSQSQKVKGMPPRRIGCNMVQFEESDVSKLTVLRKLEEAAEEVKHSKEYLEKALSRVKLASRKQYAAEEALRSWTPNHDPKVWGIYSSPKLNNLNPVDHDMASDPNQRPVSKPTISMRDVLSRKQIQPEECVMRRQPERQKVALSQMLQELRDDLTFSPKGEKEGSEQRQFLAQRKKFGFIHISLPLTKQRSLLRKGGVLTNIYELCDIDLKDFSVQAYGQGGCLLRSLPSDMVLDNITGFSITCDLTDNIAAPWPLSSTMSSLSLCTPEMSLPALPTSETFKNPGMC